MLVPFSINVNGNIFQCLCISFEFYSVLMTKAKIFQKHQFYPKNYTLTNASLYEQV